MMWGGSPWKVTFKKDGDYTCQGGISVRYVGSWSVRDGDLWITESSNPNILAFWCVYRIRLCPKALTGQVEFGSVGTKVELRRVE